MQVSGIKCQVLNTATDSCSEALQHIGGKYMKRILWRVLARPQLLRWIILPVDDGGNSKLPLCDIKTMLNNHSVPACDCFNLHLRNTYPGLLTYWLLLYISANDRGVKTSHFFKLDSKCCALTTLCTWHRLVKVREGTRWTSLGVFIQISVLSHNKPGWKKSRCPGRKYPAVPDEQLNTLFNTVL